MHTPGGHDSITCVAARPGCYRDLTTGKPICSSEGVVLNSSKNASGFLVVRFSSSGTLDGTKARRPRELGLRECDESIASFTSRRGPPDRREHLVDRLLVESHICCCSHSVDAPTRSWLGEAEGGEERQRTITEQHVRRRGAHFRKSIAVMFLTSSVVVIGRCFVKCSYHASNPRSLMNFLTSSSWLTRSRPRSRSRSRSLSLQLQGFQTGSAMCNGEQR